MINKASEQHREYGVLTTYDLTNANGVRVTINNVGCAIQSVLVPDRDGHMADVVLGYDTAETYVFNRKYYFGCILGRCANRIKDGDLVIDGHHYQLTQNAGTDHLHGGFKGYDRMIFTPDVIERDGRELLALTYISPHGEEGYPGELHLTATYELDDENNLIIDYTGTTDADTIVNMSNHSFFNLAGHGSGPVFQHQLMIPAESFIPIDGAGIPTGEIRSVAGTPFDFRAMTYIGEGLHAEDEQIALGGGYSHHFMIGGRGLRKAAELYEPAKGRLMEVFTTMPGVLLFSGNRLDGMDTCKDGATYVYRGAVCLETEYCPDACHHPAFQSPVLRAGERYDHRTIYRFSYR